MAFKDIKNHQIIDSLLMKVVKNIKNNPNYSSKEGILLYKTQNQNRHRVVLPSHSFDMISMKPHNAYLGITKTIYRISMTKNVFLYFGFPKFVVSDNVSHFCSR